MKVDLTHKFIDLNGEVMKDEKGKDVTLYQALRVCVTADLKEDAEGSSSTVIEAKMKNYDIFLDVTDAGPDCTDFDLSAEHIVHIKNRIGKVFGVIVAGPVVRLLEGKPPYGKVKEPTPVTAR